MDRAFLEGLGLKVIDSDGVVEAEFELTSGLALNPLTRTPVGSVSFTLLGDRLLYVGPPEFVGAQPINLAFLSASSRLEDLVVQTLNDHLFQLERRSSELAALGVSPKVDPSTLQLSAELERGPFRFTLGASRAGQFRVSRCYHDGQELTIHAPTAFELSEFRTRAALEDYLYAMFSDVAGSPTPPERPKAEPAPDVDVSLSMKALFEAFGDAVVPPRTVIEFVCELKVAGQTVRFAAARVQGRTFRGLLAGPAGKLWADWFELAEFPGIRALVSDVMGVPIEQIEVVE
ncbi:MAG: hypothetical protein INH41_23470 [Myxococcaceae bacterium]|jgi:hypothetical protein|nr:hypothetical protein [Myxococcaceae bacterium]MCA3015359.1 hypothetical protein [Myxococcaceae bacterium]